MSWPEEYGGAGLSEIERIVLAEEFAKAGVPEGNQNDGFSITMVGNAIIQCGSEEQKRKFLRGSLAVKIDGVRDIANRTVDQTWRILVLVRSLMVTSG